MTTCEEAKKMRTGITIEAKIRDKGEPRTVNTKFGETQVCDAYLEDDSGSIKFTIWGDDIQKVKNGDLVKIENGYTTEFRGEVQLNKSRTGKMDVTPS
jgi:replication factor A1